MFYCPHIERSERAQLGGLGVHTLRLNTFQPSPQKKMTRVAYSYKVLMEAGELGFLWHAQRLMFQTP